MEAGAKPVAGICPKVVLIPGLVDQREFGRIHARSASRVAVGETSATAD
jgi:hypothetical protein